MRHLATLINGELVSPTGARISEPSRAVAVPDQRWSDQQRHERRVIEHHAPDDPVEEIAFLLAKAAKIARTLNDDDRRRARGFFEATNQLVHATTRLERTDQKQFERALREA